MNHFLSVKDVDDPLDLAHKALQLKYDPLRYCYDRKGQSVALLFFNSSLRTRLSTQKALFNLGVDVSVFNVGQEGWQLELADGTVMDAGKAEHVKEAAAVIGRYHDIIGIRHFASLEDREEDYRDGLLQAFREYSGVPVVNLESATTHPLQSLADLMTIIEHKPGAEVHVQLHDLRIDRPRRPVDHHALLPRSFGSDVGVMRAVVAGNQRANGEVTRAGFMVHVGAGRLFTGGTLGGGRRGQIEHIVAADQQRQLMSIHGRARLAVNHDDLPRPRIAWVIG